jgi:hypothetical protein
MAIVFSPKQSVSLTWAFLPVIAASLAGLLVSPAFGEEDHSEHAEHQHQMTAEQLAELRAKIPLYDEYTDEQIVQGMSRMKNSWGWVTETEDGNTIGVLALAHGFKEVGNEQFRTAFANAVQEYPVTYAFGMAMMTSDHIQSAVSALEAAGAETIIVLPTTTADNSTLVNQWDYIFGLTEQSAYLDVPRVTSTAKIVWSDTPTAHPVISSILLDYALENSKDPSNELVIIMGHGPQSAEDNAKELEILAKHAEYLKTNGDFMDVKFGNVQDDSPTAVRAANVERIRGWAKAAMDEGHDVLVVTTALTESGVVARMRNDVEGVAVFNSKGLMENPRFAKWIDAVIAENVGR